MKTLAELNSKWYWRLLKVIGFLLYTLVFIGSSVGIYFYFSHYNPIKLENAQHSIEEKSNISNSLEYIKKQLPGDDLKLKDLKKIIKKEYLNDVNALAINFVMIEFLGKKMNQISVCRREIRLGCSGDPVGTYIEDSINDDSYNFVVTISNNTYQDAKNTFNEYYNIEKRASESITSLIKGRSTWEWDSFYDFKNKYGIDIYDITGKSDEYRSIFDYIKIIFSIIGVLGGILLVNFIILRTIFYIVLGKFNPEK